jgi:hypothetical protein
MGEPRLADAPRWSQFDRDVVLAWQEWQDGLCSCGVPRDQGWTKEAVGQWEPDVRRCHVCAAQERGLEQYRANEKQGIKVDMAGLKPSAKPAVSPSEGELP